MLDVRWLGITAGLLAGVCGAAHAQLPEPCEGRTQIARRLTVFCAYSGCQGEPSLGFEYKAICTSWCCPNGTIEIDMTSCSGAFQTGKCCPPSQGPYAPKFACVIQGG